jgi:hypothetical protein
MVYMVVGYYMGIRKIVREKELWMELAQNGLGVSAVEYSGSETSDIRELDTWLVNSNMRKRRKLLFEQRNLVPFQLKGYPTTTSIPYKPEYVMCPHIRINTQTHTMTGRNRMDRNN